MSMKKSMPSAISRSKDNVFESINLDDLSLQLEESQIPEGMVLLEELEALPDNNVNAEADPAIPSTQNQTFDSNKLETLVGSPQRLQFSKIDAIIKTGLPQNESLTPRAMEDENNSQIANDSDSVCVWSFHDKLIVSENQTVPSESSDCDDLTLELDRQYLNQPVVSRSVNPIEHWNKLKLAYSTLDSCALKYLSIVATSVPSE